MTIKPLIDEYADYDRWANTRFVQRLQREPEATLDRPAASSFPTLRATLLHIRDAENTWWGRLTGTPTTWPAEGSLAIESLLVHAGRFHDRVHAMDDRELTAEVSYRDLKGREHRQPAWQMIMHCLNHSTQHRGQLITQMRSLGLADIPANDLIAYQRSLTARIP